MSLAEQLYHCTKQLAIHLQKGLPQTDRESYIEKIEQLLDERQQLIAQLPPSFDGEVSIIGKEILKDDRLIQKMLKSMFDEIKGDIHHLQHQRRMQTRYAHPHMNGSADGMFLDKRK